MHSHGLCHDLSLDMSFSRTGVFDLFTHKLIIHKELFPNSE
jgi:hypothetical protein